MKILLLIICWVMVIGQTSGDEIEVKLVGLAVFLNKLPRLRFV